MPKRTQIVEKHVLVPRHIKLSDKDNQALLEQYNISIKELPKIQKDDPAIAKLDVKPGDVIKIIRKSPTAGEADFYRSVTNV